MTITHYLIMYNIVWLRKSKLTHPALVWTRPCREGVQYWSKNWGTDIPRNRVSPMIIRFLMQFRFVNWRNDIPIEAVNKGK